MKLTMLGTGNALVTKIYNTCFVLEDNHQYFMVDAGGGNQILTQLKKAGYDWKDMKHIFLTHKHIDHLLGMVWMMRMITQFMNAGKYEGDAYIYGHDEVIHILKDMADTLLVPKQSALIGKRLHLVEVKDQETKEIMGHPVTFFDIHSTKAKQFGFMVEYDGKKLTCLVMNLIVKKRKSMQKMQMYSCMKHSVYMKKETSDILMKSIIQQ